MRLVDMVMFGIVFPLMFCLAGGLFARKGFIHLKTKRDKKRRCLMQTYGKILNISSIKMNKGRSYFPTYEYEVGTEVIRVEIDLGTRHCQYRIGDRVKIWYDTNSPSYSYIEGYKEDTFAAVGGLILGSIAVLCGLFVGIVMWLSL